MMRDAINNFSTQLAYEPVIENADTLKRYSAFIVAGMGGSNLAPGLLKIWKPELDIASHRDYGLPYISDAAARQTLLVASSYSGNTEETLDAFEEAGRRGLARAAVSAGGTLLESARRSGSPFIRLPDTGIQPRSALGFSLMALLKIIEADAALSEARALTETLRPADFEAQGRELAQKLSGRIPVTYSSARNGAIAHNWKIKFNETGKIPAFYNVFPELNHNEMTGHDTRGGTKDLSRNFFFIFLKDAADDPRVLKRMAATEELYRDRGLPAAVVEMRGASVLEKIFSSLLVADWAAYYTAEGYGVEPEQVPMVEEFKKLIV